MKKLKFYHIFPRISGRKLSLYSIISVAVFLIIWTILTEFKIIPAVILPSPFKILTKMASVLEKGYADHSLFYHIGISLYRVLLSLLLATILAVPLGIFVAINDYFKSVLDPFVEFYRPLPPLAYLPLIIIWFGIGESSKIILISLAIFAPIFLNTRAGVRAIPKERLDAALCLGASKGQLVTKIIFPSILHSILTGIRIGIGFGWTTLVAAEMVAANSGLGHMVLSASEFLATKVVIIGIFVIGLIAIGTDYLMRLLIKKLIHWH